MPPYRALQAILPDRRSYQQLLLVILLACCPVLWAQPVAIGPQDLNWLRQHTEFSSDWSETELFDLGRPLSLNVTLRGLELPEADGNAILLFSVDGPQRQLGVRDVDARYVFRATLQLADEVRRLNLSQRELGHGAKAVLRGWPSTPKNLSGSVLLVDDIELASAGARVSLHANNPRMRDKRRDSVEPNETH